MTVADEDIVEGDDRETKPNAVDECITRIARYVRIARLLAGVALVLAVVHLALIIIG
jgi:hypothetical protein